MSICDKCVHREVCCDEGMGEEALKFCANLLEERPKGKWKFTTHHARRYRACSVCGAEREDDHSTGWYYCPCCGAELT